MFQETGGIVGIIPDDNHIFTVTIGCSLRVVETAGLDVLSINNNVLVMMNLVAGNSAEWNTRIHKQIQSAESFYKAREFDTRNNPEINIVLISVGDLNAVRQAYPNYFLDTNVFYKNHARI